MLFHSTKKTTELHIINLNKKQNATKKRLAAATDTKEDTKLCKKLYGKLKKEKTANETEEKKADAAVFVLDFQGDIKASAADKLREEISAILSCAKEGDEVVLRLESAGGQVHGYGMAAAQLERIKSAGLTLTVCVDKVAASGGYMMACVADKIIAAPFAIAGSIGVVSQMPNFYDFLKKHDIHMELFTAGEYKRTVTMFGENDDEDRAKYQAELERIHELFQAHIEKHRPSLDVKKVATGEFWFGSDALTLGLVDELGVSDSYILEKMQNHTVLALHTQQKPTVAEKLGLAQACGDVLSKATTFAKDAPFLNKLSSRLSL